MKLKKLLAVVLVLLMVLSLAACGGDDTESSAEPSSSSKKAGEGTPLESMNFIKVPDDIVGSTWEFCGGFKDGVELDNAAATETLKTYGGKLQIHFVDAANVEYIQGGGTIDGTCGADENEDMVVITIENEGKEITYTGLFADLNGKTILVLLAENDANNAFYFKAVTE